MKSINKTEVGVICDRSLKHPRTPKGWRWNFCHLRKLVESLKKEKPTQKIKISLNTVVFDGKIGFSVREIKSTKIYSLSTLRSRYRSLDEAYTLANMF